MNYLKHLVALLCLILCSTSNARTWTDVEGRKMEAELVRVENGEAVFRMSSGMHARFPVTNLSDADQNFIKENQSSAESSTSSGATDTPTALKETELTEWLSKRLVAIDGKSVKRVKESRLPQAEYIALYYSASWCPPCRKFTPSLVDFYNKNKKRHDNFELIFVSSDSNPEEQESYMVDYKMPWPAVKHEDAEDSAVRKFSGSGIPCLVVVDRKGKLLAHSYVDGKYVGPTTVMDQLDELLD